MVFRFLRTRRDSCLLTASCPELNASSESYFKSNLNSLVWSACESVCTTDPTILPARKVVLALVSDPLDNHEIAFGVVRLALHLFSQRCVWRWGSVLPTVARGALAALRRIPTPPVIPLSALSCASRRICGRMAWVGIPPSSPAPRLCTRLRNPAVREGSGPVVDAPCPPALLVVYPVLFFAAHPRLRAALSAAWSNFCA